MGDVDGAPVPDALDGVLEVATMEAVFAAQKLRRVDVMRRELLAEAESAGLGVGEVIERGIRLELAAALRVTEYAAGRMITLADAFVHRYPAVLESLAGGRITLKHAEILVDAVDELMPDLRDAVAAQALVLAEAEPVGTFRRGLQALIEKAQAPTIEERWAAAVKNRRVVLEPGQDGAGLLLIYGPIVELHAIHGRATAIAKTIFGRDGDTRTLDQIRTDVICDLLIDGITDAMPAEARGIRASVVVTAPVMALLSDKAAHGRGSAGRGRHRADPGIRRPGTVRRGRLLDAGAHPPRDRDGALRRPRPIPTPGTAAQTREMAGRPMHGTRLRDARLPMPDRSQRRLGRRRPHLASRTTARSAKGTTPSNTTATGTIRQIPGSGGAIEWTSPTGRVYIVQPERRVPVFTVDPTAGAEPVAPF